MFYQKTLNSETYRYYQYVLKTKTLQKQVQQLTYQILLNNKKVVEEFVNSFLTIGDEETIIHSFEVFLSMSKILLKIKPSISNEDLELFLLSTLLHDIGKQNTIFQENVIKNPNQKIPQEIKKIHTDKGPLYVEILLKKYNFNENQINFVKNIVRYHHEKTDGTGYYGLFLKNELLEILHYCDIFCALLQERTYKKPLSIEKSIEIIKDMNGSYFVDNIVPILLN